MEKKILTTVFVFSIIFWLVFVFVSGYSQHPLGLYTQIPLVAIPVFGGLIGLKRFAEWGKFKSVIGRAVFWLSTGMLLWGIAIAIWTYFLSVEVLLPYPSIADYVFVFSSISHIVGLVFLSRVVGVSQGLRTFNGKMVALFVTFVLVSFSYYVIVIVAHNNVLVLPTDTVIQSFFNYAYTIASLIDITIIGAIYFVSRKYLGGTFKIPVLTLLVGFLIHFFAIFFFVKTISSGAYFNGNIADILFTIAVFLESLGLVSLDPDYSK